MNTINPINNVSFNSRYLNLELMDKLPPRISEAIYKSEAVDNFLKAGKPKTLVDKIIDFFRKDEIIDIFHIVNKGESYDRYEQKESLSFYIKKGKCIEKTATLFAEQEGILRQDGSIPKPGEDPIFKAPLETAEDKLIKQIEKIKDFGKKFR